MHDHFLKSAREAIIADRPEVAVVLIATAIEQIMNTFYREILQEKNLLDSDEITEVIRTSNNNAKLGWLLALVAEYEIYEPLVLVFSSLFSHLDTKSKEKAFSAPHFE